jgi:3-methyladenine DNA glycosylase AlkD
VKTQEARELGKAVATLVQAERTEDAYALLSPVLAQRTPFRLLRVIGDAVGAGPLATTHVFLDRVALDRTEGGWVVIASALAQHLDRDRSYTFSRCREFIIAADVWYATDIMGEDVLGVALVTDFEPSLAHLVPWRSDANAWVRRAVGTSVHYWAKRSRGDPDEATQAEALLSFLEPMFEERDMVAVKGVGWGLKTMGKHYPDLLEDWLARQVVSGDRRYRALMLRKALTYLSEEQRERVLE